LSARSVVTVSWVCIIWGAGFSLMKVGLRYLPPFLYVGLRFAVTALLVGLLVWASGRSLRVPRRAWGRLAAITAMFFLQQGAIFWGLTYTTAGRMGLLLNTQPIITAVLAHWFVAHDRLTWSKVLGLLLAVSGVFFVFRESFAHEAAGMRFGDVLALIAAVSWGAQNIVTKHIVQDMRPAAITTWQAGISSLLFFATALLVGTGPLPRRPLDLAFYGATAYIILVATVLGFVVWVYLIERNPPSRVTSFCFITPIASLFFGWLLLGEALSPDVAVATVLVGAGIFIANHEWAGGSRQSAAHSPGGATGGAENG